MFCARTIWLVLFSILFSVANAQFEADQELPFKEPSDSSSLVKRHSPKKAAILSAVLPGAGQVYNKKYWKLPIVYGGLAGLGTWVGFNAKNLRGFTNAYKMELENTGSGSYKGFTGSQLNVKRDDAKRNLDLSIILISVFYALNIVDATVDAHLYDYSITDDLSVSIQPDFDYYQASTGYRPKVGLNFSMHFHQVK